MRRITLRSCVGNDLLISTHRYFVSVSDFQFPLGVYIYPQQHLSMLISSQHIISTFVYITICFTLSAYLCLLYSSLFSFALIHPMTLYYNACMQVTLHYIYHAIDVRSSLAYAINMDLRHVNLVNLETVDHWSFFISNLTKSLTTSED